MIRIDRVRAKKGAEFALRTTANFLLILALLVGGFISVHVILGYSPVVITSPSMSPVLNENDLIFIKKTDRLEDLNEGDIVTFRQPSSNVIVTHRVNRIEAEKGWLFTKGDGNIEEDPVPVLIDDIFGVYIYKIPGIGRFMIR